MTRGRAATPEPFDLGAVAGSDELFEALSTRRLADLNTGRADAGDPAVSLLAALVADVDADAPPLPVARPRLSCGMPAGRRRGVRAFVTFGVAALVLTSAGAAAAGGGHNTGAMRTTHVPAGTSGADRSNANAQRHAPIGDGPPPDRRPVERHPGRAHHAVSQRNAPARQADNLSSDHHGHHQSRWGAHAPTDVSRPTPDPVTPSPSPTGQTPTPAPEDQDLAP